MYPLFTILSKLLGFVFVYWGIPNLIYAIGYIPSVFRAVGINILWEPSLIGNLFCAVFAFCMSFLFIFRTEALASFLGIERSENIATSLSTQDILRAGLILIGMFVFVQSIAPLIRFVVLRTAILQFGKSFSMFGYDPAFITRETSIIELVSRSIPVIISLIFIFAAHYIVKIVYRSQKI